MDKYQGEDFRWNADRPVNRDDFNSMNEVAIFAGPLETMYAEITPQELDILMKRGVDLRLVDIRGRAEFDSGRICGAMNIPVADIERRGPALLDGEDLVVTYGENARCTASAVAADKLVTLNFKHVLRLKDGIERWKRAGYCTESGALRKAA